MKTIVPDTGVLIDGRISQLLEKEKNFKLIVPEAVVAELEFQANAGREIGFAGLAELKKLSQLAKEKQIDMEFLGERPTAFQIERARFGEIDANIRRMAREHDAVLMTTDKVQTRVAEAEGIAVQYLQPVHTQAKLPLEKFFTKDTLSVHLKENTCPKAKRGKPGAFTLEKIADQPITRKDIEGLMKESVEFCKQHERSFIEIDKKGATVMQIKDFRVTYTRPPVSEAFEVTIVRPITKLFLDDYTLSDGLRERLDGKAEGILIAGPPGSGKSTFATALAEHYNAQHKIVKTMESPRDLQVSPDITQYAPVEGKFEDTADILLLVRPDYTIYDEVRKPDDFRVFADLRLSGIGMVGIVHASQPIDAIQRFIGKIELGMIPQVIDTICFIDKGAVAKTYSLRFVVRPPHGMGDPDLARPVIEVSDLETQRLEYEIYKFGDEVVVFPVKNAKPLPKVDEKKVSKILSRAIKGPFEFEVSGTKVLLFVPERGMSAIIGKKGKNISQLERQLGLKVDVRAK